MKDYAEVLRYANLTIALIDRAQRQERRLQKSYRRLREVEVGDGVGWAPPEYGRAMARFDDDLYFLVVALRQVSRGRELLEHLGHQMPPMRQDALVRAWRNIEEHWDDPGRGEPIRALKNWAQESNEVEPGLTHSGAAKLHTASGLRIKWVRKDLRALREAADAVSESEWHHCYITAEEAAAILEMTLEEFDHLQPPPMNLDFEGEDGVRFFREAVEARAAGHLLPPRWVQERWV